VKSLSNVSQPTDQGEDLISFEDLVDNHPICFNPGPEYFNISQFLHFPSCAKTILSNKTQIKKTNKHFFIIA